MSQTRVDSKKLAVAVAGALKHMDEAFQLLEPFLVALTEEERQSALRPREAFPLAGRQLARAVVSHPHLGQSAGFDPQAVVEDLDNVEALQPLAEKATLLQQRLTDSRIAWLAEAYQPSLALYSVAKVVAKTDGKVREVVEPLAQVFAAARSPRKATEPAK